MKTGIASVIFLILIGLILGLLISGMPVNATLLTLAGIFIFYLVFACPVAIIAFLLFVVPFNILWLGVGITPFEAIYGLTYVILVLLWISRRIIGGIFSASGGKDRPESLISPITLPLIIFFGFALLACIIGVLRGHKFQHWGSDLNTIMYYGLCFVMLDSVKDKKTLYRLFSLVLFSMVMGLVKALYDIMQAPYPHMGTQMMGIQHITLSSTNLTGLAIFIISVAIAITLAKSRKKTIFSMLSLFFGIMIIASFSRALWISAVFGLASLFFISLGKGKRNFLKLILAGILLSSLYLSIVISLPLDNPLARSLQNVGERYRSIFTVMTEPTIITRDVELREAVKKGLMHPFFGNGLGTHVTYFRHDRWFGAQIWSSTRYIHNVYVYLFLNMGFLGLLSFLWFCIALIKYALGLYGSLKDEMDKGLTLGIICAFLSLMVASLAGPLLIVPTVTMWFGFFIGTLIIIDRSRGGIEAKT